MRILILGASGMIGQAVRQALRQVKGAVVLPASHRKLDGYVHVDFGSLTKPSSWVRVLQAHKVDAVINCVGIWKGSDEEFERIQYEVPVALFQACDQLKLKLVHVSAVGFTKDTPLPYVSTKARADEFLLTHCSQGVVVLPSLVFGSDGNSSRFFLKLAALPVHMGFGFPRNLQPVHVRDVADAVVDALIHPTASRQVISAGQRQLDTTGYFRALRKGMGLGAPWLTLRLPRFLAKAFFMAGEKLNAHFVNRQTWLLLEAGTCDTREHPEAWPYEKFATKADLERVQDFQLYWAARLGMAFIWLWTAIVSLWAWPTAQTLSWLSALHPSLGSMPWLAASAALDAAMGVLSLTYARRWLWKAQFSLVAIYSAGLLYALPEFALHPFGPLSKNIAILVLLACLAKAEKER